jgi:hypothetical protein
MSNLSVLFLTVASLGPKKNNYLERTDEQGRDEITSGLAWRKFNEVDNIDVPKPRSEDKS